jgi:hypothetical protein
MPRPYRRISATVLLSLVVSMVGVLGAAAPARALGASYVVNDNGDQPDHTRNGECSVGAATGGPCTLRAAIQEANDDGVGVANTISFAASVSTVSVGSPLPTIRTGPVTLDARNHPGLVANPNAPATPGVTLEAVGSTVGTNCGTCAFLLGPNASAGVGIQVEGVPFEMYGLRLRGFGMAGAFIYGSQAVEVQNNEFVSNDRFLPGVLGQHGLYIKSSSAVRIGGLLADQGNVFHHAINAAVQLDTVTNGVVSNNLVGYRADGAQIAKPAVTGTEAYGGVAIQGTDLNVSANRITAVGFAVVGSGLLTRVDVNNNVVGIDSGGLPATGGGGVKLSGDAATTSVRIRDNVIGNVGSAVQLSGPAVAGVRIEGNTLGTDLLRLFVYPNRRGIEIANGAHDNVVGYDRTVLINPQASCGAGAICNVIHNSIEGAVIIGSAVGGVAPAGVGNTVRGNAMVKNQGLGIDLGDIGVTANDGTASGLDADSGPNTLINAPVGVAASYAVTSYTGANTTRAVSISGFLMNPNPTTLIIDVYRVPADHQVPPRAARSTSAFDANTLLWNAPASSITNPATYGNPVEYVGTVLPSEIDPWGQFRLRLPSTVPYSATDAFVAVATDSQGNTSEPSAFCADIDQSGSADNDGDSLCDEWETYGMDTDRTGSVELDLPALGANAAKKDVFVEIDALQGSPLGLPQPELFEVVDAFRAAPTPTAAHPNFPGPIDLHLATPNSTTPVDEIVTSSAVPGLDLSLPVDVDGEVILPGDRVELVEIRFGQRSLFVRPCGGLGGSATERASANCAAQQFARMITHRYAFFGKSILSAGGSTLGKAAFGGSVAAFAMDQPVEDLRAMGASGYLDPDPAHNGCSTDRQCAGFMQQGIFMHELGHMLGLNHSNDDLVEFEPNFLSVMNYRYTTRAKVPYRPLDYARYDVASIDESSVSESAGLAADPSDAAAIRTAWPWVAFNQEGAAPTDKCVVRRALNTAAGIDWNLNQAIDAAPYATDLNSKNLDAGTSDRCMGTAGLLTASTEWDRLDFDLRDGRLVDYPWGNFDNEPTVEVLVPPTADADNDGVINTADNCPWVANPLQEDANGTDDGAGAGDACETPPTSADLSVRMSPTNYSAPAIGATIPFEVVVRNDGPLATTNVKVKIEVLGLAGSALGGTATFGTFNASTGLWTIPSIAAGSERKLNFTVVYQGRATVRAYVLASAQPDADSTPGNTLVGEDDLVLVKVGGGAPPQVTFPPASPGAETAPAVTVIAAGPGLVIPPIDPTRFWCLELDPNSYGGATCFRPPPPSDGSQPTPLIDMQLGTSWHGGEGTLATFRIQLDPGCCGLNRPLMTNVRFRVTLPPGATVVSSTVGLQWAFYGPRRPTIGAGPNELWFTVPWLNLFWQREFTILMPNSVSGSVAAELVSWDQRSPFVGYVGLTRLRTFTGPENGGVTVPPNDLPAGAVALTTASGSATVDFIGASTNINVTVPSGVFDYELSNGPPQGRPIVWYAWTAPSDGMFTASSIGLTDVHLFPPSGAAPSLGYYPIPVSAGDRVLIAVSVRNAFGGPNSTQLVWTFTPRPANDDFADATDLTGTGATLTPVIAAATVEPGEPEGYATAATVWYRYQATSPSVITISGGSAELLSGTSLTDLVDVSPAQALGSGQTIWIRASSSAAFTWAVEPDGDGDGVADSSDNCVAVANADQVDLDVDGIGDACDPDVDVSGSIAGRVFAAASGVPVAGARIAILDVNNANAEVASATTGPDGRYIVTVQPGTYVAEASLATWTGGVSAPGTVVGAVEDVTNVDVALSRPTITGTVTIANGVSPAAGIEVIATSPSAVISISALTRFDGTYLLEVPTDLNEFYIEARDPNGDLEPEYWPDASSLDDANLVGPGAQNINFDLAGGGVVSGVVTGPDGITPVQGATVQLFDYGSSVVASQTTLADGSWVLGVPQGSYVVRASAPNWAPMYHGETGSVSGYALATRVEIESGATTPMIDVALANPMTVEGVVIPPWYVPGVDVSMLQVDVFEANTSVLLVSLNPDDDGEFSFAANGGVRYVIRVTDPQRRLVTAEQLISEPAVSNGLNYIYLEDGAFAEGVVSNAGSQPVTVEIRDSNGFDRETITLTQATFATRVLPFGTYEARAITYDRRPSPWVPFTLTSADVTGLDLMLQAELTISGTVTAPGNGGNTPIAGATVTGYVGGLDLFSTTTQADGSYVLPLAATESTVDVYVSAEATTYVRQFYDGVLTLDDASAVEPGRTDLNFVLTPSAEVFLDHSFTVVADDTGAPLEGVCLWMRRLNGGYGPGCTDANGAVTFGTIRAGEYQITSFGVGIYGGGSLGTVLVEPGGPETTELRLVEGGSVRVTIVDEVTGLPVDGTLCVFVSDTGSLLPLCGSTNPFNYGPLAPGSYLVYGEAAGYVGEFYTTNPPFVDSVAVVAGQATDITLALAPATEPPPVLTIDTAPPAVTASAVATIEFSVAGEVSSIECSVDGGPAEECSSPYLTGALADGPHSVSITATGPGGVDSATVEFDVDTTAPQLQITAPSGFVVGDQVVGFTSNDSAAVYTCEIDGAPSAPCASPLSFTTPGVHGVVITATDAVGNASSATVSFTIVIPPTVTITASPAALINTATATVQWTSTGDINATSCSVDGGTATSCSSPFTTVSLTDGPHTVSVTATGPGGSDTRSVAFTVDTMAPVVTVTGPSGSVAGPQSVAFTVDDPSATVTCADSGTPLAACASPLAVTSTGAHAITITATDPAGNAGSGSSSFTITPPSPPTAPTGLTVAVAGSIVTLNWIDASSTETSFKIERRTFDRAANRWGAYVEIQSIVANSVSATDDVPLGKYQYRIRAFNESGSALSNAALISVGIPTAPTGLTSVATPTLNGVVLTWTDTSSTEESFIIRRRAYEMPSATWSAWADIATMPANATTTTDFPLPGGRYQYSVVAKNWLGMRSSNVSKIRFGDPSAPTQLAAVVTSTNVTLTWTDTSPVEDSFIIERRDYDAVAGTWGAFVTVDTVGEDVTTYVTTPPVGKFQYRVRAVNTVGSKVSSTVFATFGTPTAPTGVTASVTGGTVTVRWIDTSSTEFRFVIERRALGAGGWGAIIEVGSVTANTIEFSETPGAGSYYYRVRAVNAAGSAVSLSSRVNVS